MRAQSEILNLASEVLQRAGGANSDTLLKAINAAQSSLSGALTSKIVKSAALQEKLDDIAYVAKFFAPDEFFVQQTLLEQSELVMGEWNALTISRSFMMAEVFLEQVKEILNNPEYTVALSDIDRYYSRKLGVLPTPTGAPSKLTASQQTVVRSPEFLSWFGDWITAAQTGDYTGVSKLINPATKEPELLFHGTAPQKAFWRFDMKRTMSPVTYLSDDFEYAAWYPRNEASRGDRKAIKGGKPLVYQMFGVMRNPLDFRQFKLEQFTGEQVADIIDVTTGYRPKNTQAKNPFTGKFMDKAPLIWYFRYNAELLREFKAHTRFDGVIFVGTNPSMMTSAGTPAVENEFLFFNNGQLKLSSAAFYSSFVQDIRFKKGGLV